MLKANVIGDGKIKYYDDADLFAGYYVTVERKTIDLGGAGGPTTFGMVYVTTPKEGPHALTSLDEAEQLAEGLTRMLKSAAVIARLMDNSNDTTQT